MSDQDEFNQDIEPVQEPVIVPHRELVPETLRAVVESFVLREGTDYGAQELTLEQKVSRLMLQLDHGDAQILFDPNTQSITFVPAERAARRVPLASHRAG
jgi:uncharacterized protein YheU (UPF0270 family)